MMCATRVFYFECCNRKCWYYSKLVHVVVGAHILWTTAAHRLIP